MASAWEYPFGNHSYLEVELEKVFQLLWSLLYINEIALPSHSVATRTHNAITVVPLMRDNKESPQKTVSQKGFALFGG